MLSVRQLGKAIDSISNMDSLLVKRTETELTPYLRFLLYKDSTQLFGKKESKTPIKKLSQIIPDSLATSVGEAAGYQLASIDNNFKMLGQIYTDNKNTVAIHSIEWHRKFTLSIACLVLFLIGAPLGSIIRKGGLGTPMISAIIFFVFFFLFNNFGEKLAKSGQWSVYNGMWLSTMILVPIGIFLIYKAMRDSQLFNQEFYYRLLQPIKVTLRKYFKK
jgi:lipopolysaccharide export system permease protein